MATKVKSMSFKQTEKWMERYHDKFITAHNTLVEMLQLYKLKAVTDKRVKSMIDKYFRELRKV